MGELVDSATDADRAARRAEVIGTLADAVATLDMDGRRPVRVVLGGGGTAVAALAQDLAAVLAARGYRCRHVAGDDAGGDAGLVGDGHGSVLIVAGGPPDADQVDRWDLVVFARHAPDASGPAAGRPAPAALDHDLDPERAAGIVVDLYDPRLAGHPPRRPGHR
jgi:hypothetical protein